MFKFIGSAFVLFGAIGLPLIGVLVLFGSKSAVHEILAAILIGSGAIVMTGMMSMNYICDILEKQVAATNRLADKISAKEK